jgi:hypothetical protein
MSVVVLGAQTEHRGGGRYASRDRLAKPIPPEMQNLTDPALNGAVDIHFHVGSRQLPAIDRRARRRQARALARHARRRAQAPLQPDRGLAYLARKAAPGFEAFGGHRSQHAGGWPQRRGHPHMVENRGRLRQGRVDADPRWRERRAAGEPPFVIVSQNGELVPAALDVIKFVAERQLTLETGHSTPDGAAHDLREAKRRGAAHHRDARGQHPRPDDHRSEGSRALGAFIEFCTTGITRRPRRADCAHPRDWTRARIISSDVGSGPPLHPDSLAWFAKQLRAAASPSGDRSDVQGQPATALGLPLRRAGTRRRAA